MTIVNTSHVSKGFWLAVIAQLADLITFHLAVTTFGVALTLEDNFLMAALYGSLGFAGLLFVKIALIAYLYAILPHLTTLRSLAIIVVAAIGVLGTLTNILAIALFGT